MREGTQIVEGVELWRVDLAWGLSFIVELLTGLAFPNLQVACFAHMIARSIRSIGSWGASWKIGQTVFIILVSERQVDHDAIVVVEIVYVIYTTVRIYWRSGCKSGYSRCEVFPGVEVEIDFRDQFPLIVDHSRCSDLFCIVGKLKKKSRRGRVQVTEMLFLDSISRVHSQSRYLRARFL
jgi:hypothetical protein